MENRFLNAPHKTTNQVNQPFRKFVRKPSPRSSRSNSKKSNQSTSSLHSTYITTSKHFKRAKNKSSLTFFDQLAHQVSQQKFKTVRKQALFNDYRQQQQHRGVHQMNKQSDNDKGGMQVMNLYDYGKNSQNLSVRVNILEAQIDLKNHQIQVISGQFSHVSMLYSVQQDRRRKLEMDCENLSKSLKKQQKNHNKLQNQIKRLQKQRQYLFKQLQFLQKINFNEETRNIQTYKQKYLQQQVEELKQKLKQTKNQRQMFLQAQIQRQKHQFYILQSQYKAMKLANQVLLKKVHAIDQRFHQLILQSQQYQTLRQKYVKFLQQYKKLRNQYWALKVQLVKRCQSDSGGDSSLMDLTVSQTEHSGVLSDN